MKKEMRDKVFNSIFPIGGGSMGAVAPVIMDVTWVGVGELVIQAATFAIVGGILGWSVKRVLDYIFPKKKK